jgi:hypothetical protein
MCFSAFSFVSIADEAVAGTKTMAELRDLNSSFPANWLDNDLYEHGTKSFTRFNVAKELVEFTLGRDSTPAEITVAFILLEAARDGLYYKTKAELDALIAQVRPVYTRNNVFNDEGDAIYHTGLRSGFAAFTEAYDTAYWSTEDECKNTITDLWDDLKDAFDALDAKQVVSRTEINTLGRRIDQAAATRNRFTDERRGSASFGGETFGTFHGNWAGPFWWVENTPLTWGTLWVGDGSGNLVTGAGSTHATNNLRSGGWWQEWRPFNFSTTRFFAEAARFDGFGVTSTTDDGIVGAFNMATNIVAMINSFAADNTGNASVRTIQGTISSAHNDIVKNENVKDGPATGTSLSTARADGSRGTGALAALYAQLSATAGGWKNAGSATNMRAATRQFTVIFDRLDNAFISAAVGEAAVTDAATQNRRIFQADAVVDLTPYVRIDPRNAGGAATLGRSNLEKFDGDVFATTPATLYEAYLAAHAVGVLGNSFSLNYTNLSGETRELAEADARALINRRLVYALRDAGFGDRMVARQTLANLVESSFAIDDITVAFFRCWFAGCTGASACTVCGRDGGQTRLGVRGSRAVANEALKIVYSASDRADRVDQREYVAPFDTLNGAIGAFNSQFRMFPVAMNSGENSVYDVIMSVADTNDDDVLELRSALALRILENHDHSSHGRIFEGDIFTNAGGIDAAARIRATEGPWRGRLTHAAYVALFEATGGVGSYSKGDVNNDGVVDTADAIEILRFLAGLENGITDNARAFNAGSITADEPTTACVIEILKFIAGMESALS